MVIVAFLSSKPLLRLKYEIHERFQVIETERGAVNQASDWSLNGLEVVVAKIGPFSLTFCQIFGLMSPHRSLVTGRFDEWLGAMTDTDGHEYLSLSFDSQTAAIGIGGAIEAIGTACTVRIVDGVRRKPRPVLAVGIAG